MASIKGSGGKLQLEGHLSAYQGVGRMIRDLDAVHPFVRVLFFALYFLLRWPKVFRTSVVSIFQQSITRIRQPDVWMYLQYRNSGVRRDGYRKR